jgi:hypothetical protein
MYDFGLDNLNHDLQIKGGKLVSVISADEVAQRCKIHLQRYLGEWFLNTTLGLPYYETLLGSKDTNLIELYLRREVSKVEGVQRIVKLNIVRAIRTISIYIEIATKFNEAVTITIAGI